MIFIWIPKTGGTTFSHTEQPKMQVYTENYSEAKPHLYPSVSFGHACPRQLLKHNIITSELWARHTKVALVRNPYDRFLSLYHDYQRTGRISQGMTQAVFARAIIEMDPKPGLFNSYHLSMCAPQIEWLLPEMLIIRFEEYASTAPVKLNSGHYAYDLDPRAIDLVTDFYRADFTALNYETK